MVTDFDTALSILENRTRRSILEHLWVDFGLVLGSMFEHFSKQRGDRRIEQVCLCCFVAFSFNFLCSKLGLKVEPLTGKSGFWLVLPGRLEYAVMISCPSWLRFGTIVGQL